MLENHTHSGIGCPAVATRARSDSEEPATPLTARPPSSDFGRHITCLLTNNPYKSGDAHCPASTVMLARIDRGDRHPGPGRGSHHRQPLFSCSSKRRAVQRALRPSHPLATPPRRPKHSPHFPSRYRLPSRSQIVYTSRVSLATRSPNARCLAAALAARTSPASDPVRPGPVPRPAAPAADGPRASPRSP